MTIISDAKIHVGDVGTRFEISIRDADNSIVNISEATVKQLKFSRADGSSYTVDASFKTDGKDGILYCETEATDLTVAGEWHVQPYLELGDWKGHAAKQRFRVWPVISG